MNKSLTFSLVAAALIATGTAAYAQNQTAATTPQRGAEMTREAAQQRAAQMFARMDVNSDGKIDSADRAARVEQQFNRIDTDGNGAISLAEFTATHEARGERREQRAERRGNGEHRMAQREGRRGPGGHDGHHRRGGHGGPGGMMQGADADNDGTVTQAEFAAAALARFDAADADNNGTVTREERRAARPERPERPARPAATNS